MWYEGGALKPRRTTMPSPRPVRPWHGRAEDLELLLAARQQLRRQRTRGQLGHEVLALLAGEVDLVLAQRAARDRARDERPGRALVLEQLAVAQRLVLRLVVHVLAAGRAAGERDERQRQQRARCPAACGPGEGGHGSTSDTSTGPQAAQQLARAVEVELRVVRLDAQEEAVAARQREARHVEDRVVGLREAVEREHAEDRRERREQHRRLEGRHHPRRPGRDRPAADVERVGDHRAVVLQAEAAEEARRCRPPSTIFGTCVSCRCSASSTSSIGYGV